MPAAPVTCPNVFCDAKVEQVWLPVALHGTGIDVLTPEYCTVLNTLFAVIRISMLRVSPSDTVRDSDPFTDTVPGSSIEFRVELP